MRTGSAGGAGLAGTIAAAPVSVMPPIDTLLRDAAVHQHLPRPATAVPLIDMLLPQFDREMGTTRRLLEVVPEADLAWSPGGKCRTAGELAAHLADIPVWTCGIMDGEGYDLADLPEAAPATSVAGALDRFDDGAASGRRALAGRPDADLAADWTLRRDGRVIFSLPRISAVQGLVLNHLVHHRGQLSVYLRLRGVRVPPIYGPAAEDGERAAKVP